MSSSTGPIHPTRRNTRRFNFRKHIRVAACLITGAGLFAPPLTFAADTDPSATASDNTAAAANADKVAALEEENARLREQLKKNKKLQAQLLKTCAAEEANAPQPQVVGTTAADTPATASDIEAGGGGGGGGGASAVCTVVVESTKETQKVDRTERLHDIKDIPLSISVVSGQDLVQEDAFDIGTITKRTADVTWNQGNQRTSSISIRGVGFIGQSENMLPDVGVQVDGVPYAFNPLTSSINFFDLADVEVTHGPQGTLGGLNNSLGTIAINTRQATFTPETTYLLTYGKHDTVIGQFASGGPVIDDLLAFRASVSVDKGYGDVQNKWVTDQTFQNNDRVTGRLQFLLTPTQDLSIRLSANLTPVSGEYTNNRTLYTPTPTTYANGATVWSPTGISPLPGTSVANDLRVMRPYFSYLYPNYTYAGNYLHGSGTNSVYINGGYPVQTGSWGGALNVEWRRGEFDVTSTTGYEQYHFNARNDEGTPFAISTTGGVYDNPYEQFSEELKLKSHIGTAVDYTAGLFAMRTRTNYQNFSDWEPDAGAWYASNIQYWGGTGSIPAWAGNTGGGGTLTAANYGVGALAAPGSAANLLQNSVNGLWKDTYNDIRNRTAAAFANATWHVSKSFDVEAGVRGSYDNRRDDGFASLLNSSGQRQWGAGAGLNPVLSNNLNPVPLGGFATVANQAAKAPNLASASLTAANFALTNPNALIPVTQYVNGVTYQANTITQQQLANAVAQQYFGTNYANLTVNQLAQIYNAQALRKGQIGLLWNQVQAQTYNNITPTIFLSPSFKLSDNETAYFSYQHGEKAGIAQIVNGISSLVHTERTDAYELGLKSDLLEHTLIANVDVFWMNIHNYQQGVQVYDAYTTALNNANGISGTAYTSGTGNVPRVISRGAEFDVAYQGIQNLTLHMSGAWVDAFYKDFPNSARANEINYPNSPPYVNVNGQVLEGAAKFSLDAGAEYHWPVFGNKELHIGFDTIYRSTSNIDQSYTLSRYSWVPGNSITDLNAGFGRADGLFDVAVVVKNLTNNDVPVAKTWNSYQPAFSQWYGLQVTGHFGK
jgi:outer membrane receptor protein involved in Fe transport